MTDRGRQERVLLTAVQRAERSSLPEGMGVERSPLFDLWHSPYHLLRHLTRYYLVIDQLTAGLYKAFPVPQELPVLDVGCGFGEMYCLLRGLIKPRGYRLPYTGVDGDPLRIQRAKTLFRRGDFRLGLFPEVLHEPKKTFSGLICSEVYEHLTPGEGDRLLDAMYLVAQPGAVAVLTIPTLAYRKKRVNPLHIHEVNPAEFIPLAEAVGWRVENWFYTRLMHRRIHPNMPSFLSSLILAPTADLNGEVGQNALYVLRK